MTKCRSCGNDLIEVFSLGDLYVSDFLKTNEQSEYDGYYARKKYPLTMMLCESCGLAQLKDSAPADKMYGKYWYRSGINSTMRAALQDVAESAIKSIHPKDGDVFLDIACNDGTLLSYVPDNMLRIGIDPADNSYRNESIGHADDIIQDYFSLEAYNKSKAAGKKAKIITVIAMFYDLENPKQFLEEVREVLDDDGLLVMQLSYTPLMIQQLAFDNICHEHICYYSLSSLEYLLSEVGFQIVDCDLNDINGGSFRVYIMKKEADISKFRTSPARDVANFRVEAISRHERLLETDVPSTYMDFYEDICTLRDETVNFIKAAQKRYGENVWAYGASTKGNTLLQWYELDNTLIGGIAERSPYKYGLRTVGTNIPIYSEEEMRKEDPNYLLILPWHFVNEFRNREADYLNNGGKFIVPCPRFEVIKNDQR